MQETMLAIPKVYVAAKVTACACAGVIHCVYLEVLNSVFHPAVRPWRESAPAIGDFKWANSNY